MKTKKYPVLTVEQVERAIDMKTSCWAGQCYGVAQALVNARILPGRARAVYGHYRGTIDPKSMFGSHQGHGFCRHGWILIDDAPGQLRRILLDPTRWVFESVDPYLYWADVLAGHDDYDEGGNVLRHALRRPAPRFDSKKPAGLKLPRRTLAFVEEQLGDQRGICRARALWLANLTPSELGEHAKPLFRALIAANHGSYIPIDNRRAVLGA
jgi:hypothetical protein